MTLTPPPNSQRVALYLVLVLNIIVFVAVNGARIVFSLYSLDLGASAAGVGAIAALMYVFPLLLSWPIGALGDRFGARWLLVAGVGCGACAMIIPVVTPSLLSLYIASTMLGLPVAFALVLGQYLVGQLSRPENRTKNFSNYALSGSACLLLAPLIAGFSLDHFGSQITCLAIAGVLMLGVVLLLSLGGWLPPSTGEKRQRGGNVLLLTLKDRQAWKILAVSSAAQLGNDLFLTFLPIHGQGIGLSATIIGSLLSACALGAFAVRLIMMRLIGGLGERRTLSVAFYLAAAVLFLVPFGDSAAVLIFLAFLFGCSFGCTKTLTMVLMASDAQEGRSGELIGLRLTANNLARILGPAALGVIGAVAGLMAVFWFNGVMMAAGARIGSFIKPERGEKE